jgi:hypothetical protein
MATPITILKLIQINVIEISFYSLNKENLEIISNNISGEDKKKKNIK